MLGVKIYQLFYAKPVDVLIYTPLRLFVFFPAVPVLH